MYSEGSLSATRLDLDVWMKTLPQPWSAAMEDTMIDRLCGHYEGHTIDLVAASRRADLFLLLRWRTG